eukprot:CAMPEP_0174300260 /NCGR_PEP_ID=MMETSP0809-20121228/58360_1 /TAXON_ID=73025 ORGANISM="Eutreptiella gymnastica-like, Strain CCMP1594" /NCGR_SAMPLE_ID=MMETSP0809 /ASSEMBLY_ACC=CAM_ASM_000658 /LENGTH=632 /DNA_ID=CAMNT_0015405813 /DNA_START=62 /DNA_END=1961 /DNA_ORIENTATION=-
MACHHSLPTLSSMTLDEASSCTQCAGSTSSRKLLAALSVLGTTVGITMAMHATVSGDRAAAVQLQLINPAASHVGSTASRLRVPPSMRQPAHRSGVIASALADPGIQASDLPPTQVRSESVQAQVLSAAETIAPSVVMERPSEEFLRAERASKTSSFLACALALGGLLLGAWAIMRGFQRRPRQSTTEAAAEGRTRTYASMCTAPNEPSINQLVYAFTEKSAEETVVSMATPHKERTRFVAETLLPTTSGTYRVRSYKHTLDGITFTDPIAIIAGKPEGADKVRSESAQAQVLSAAETIAPSVVMERPSEEFLRAERASKTSSFLACALALGGLLLGAWAIMRGFQRRPRQSTTEAAAEGRTRTYASMCTAPNEPSINQLVYAFTEKSAEETVVSMATPHKERTRFVAETLLPTTSGTYRVRSYKHTLDGITFTDPIAIIAGKPEGAESVPVRVHDACWTSEVIGSLKCDCAQQLAQAMDYIRDNEQGIVLYLHQEGRGIGLANKIAAYRMQEQGVDTVEANRMLGLPDDSREYTAVKDILEDINVQSIGLMTNNPRKVKELRSLGISISKRISCIVADPGEIASQYVQTKREQMGHFDSDEEDVDVLCVWTEDEQKAQRFGTKGAHGDGGF